MNAGSTKNPAASVLVTGGTGYLGRPLIASLVARGHQVRALVRPSSQTRVPRGATAVIGDALDSASVLAALEPGDSLVHLVGTPHPSPAKAVEFRRVDLASIKASVEAAARAGAAHLVYVSVAQPAPVMNAYLDVRAEGEGLIRNTGLTATILRPWYVLGPGHRWPVVFIPLYAVASLVPRWREGARRLGLVTLEQMVRALISAVENPPSPGEVVVRGVSDIRAA